MISPNRKMAYLALLLVSAIWGSAAPIIKFSLGGIAPLLFLVIRFGISSVVSLILEARNGFKYFRDIKKLGILFGYGLITSTIALGLLFLGIERTTAIDASLISAMGPIVITIAGVVFLKEHVTGREKVGISIAFAGTLITMFEPIFKHSNGDSGLIGNFLIFLSILVGATGAILTKKLLREEIDPLSISNISFIAGFLSLVPIALYNYSGQELISVITSISLPIWLGILYMALISGNLAYFLSNKAQKTIEVSEAGLFGYLYPLFGAPLAIIWLGEKITPPFIIGAVTIAAGVILAEFKKKSKS